MRKKALSWLLAASMVLSLFAALPGTAKALENTCEVIDTNVSKVEGGVVSGMNILAAEDLLGSYEGLTEVQMRTKTSFVGWPWYVSGGSAP